MITLKQTEHNLLGSKKDISALESAPHARILVVSDSHGSRDLFHYIVEQQGPSCSALAFCGDGMGDFASCMDDASADSEFARCIPPVASFAEGNGDSDLFPVRFNPGKKASSGIYFELAVPRRQLLKAAGHTIYIVHGHERGVYYGTQPLEEEAQIAGADIVLYGHTHIADETRGSVYMLNPGSISHPRGGTPPSFAVLDLGSTDINAVFYRIDVSGGKIQFIPFIPEKTSLWM